MSPTDTLPEEAVDATVTDAPITEGVEPQVETAPKTFDPASITPEIKSYYEKQYKDHVRFKEYATEYEQLLRAPEFQEWYKGLKAPKQPAPEQEITDEQFQAALSDKKNLSALIRAEAKRLLDSEYAPQLSEVKRENDFVKKSSELDKVMTKYPDFADLDDRGLIEPLVREGLSFERAYKLAKWENFNEEVDRRARGLVEKKKAASVEKPGATANAKSRRVKVKSKEEAMMIAAEAFKAGREAPEIDFE